MQFDMTVEKNLRKISCVNFQIDYGQSQTDLIWKVYTKDIHDIIPLF